MFARWRRKMGATPPPTDEDLNEFPDMNITLAGMTVETMKPVIPVALEQLGAIYRWLLASLVTVNGGALIGMLASKETFAFNSMKVAAVLFITGIVLAILTALFAALGSKAAFNLAGEHIGYWAIVQRDGERLASHEAKLKIKETATVRVQHRSILIGLLSLLCFVGGVSVAMSGFTLPSAP